MTRHIDTYWAVIQAAPLIWEWWGEPIETTPTDDEFGDHPHKWLHWSVNVPELDDDGKTVAIYMFTHETIVRACERILEGIDGHAFRDVVTDNVRELIYGDPENVDFDSDTADVVLQVAAFGEVRYS
jgi:hypothetical protein